MSPKKSSNISNSTPNDATKKTASARNQIAEIVVGLSLFVAASFGLAMRQPTAVVQLGDAHINVLVAADDAARTKGLGGRNTLGAQQGMLFDFGTGGRWNVWMKDMRFAIDIVWLNSDKQVVWVEPMVSPATYPQPFKPFGDARYVLELGSGEAAKNNIDIGDYATFSLSPAIK